MGYRAQAGAKMLYDFLTEALAPHETRIARRRASKSALGKPSPQQRASQNTLTPADLAPAWRGPPARKTGHAFGIIRSCGPLAARRERRSRRTTSICRSHAPYIKADVGRTTMADIEEIIDNFSVLDDWDDRYRYLIELGRELPPLAESAHNDANKVQGCASQVWLDTDVRPNGADGPVLTFAGDSDAHIVRGLIAILFAIFSGKTANDILAIDALALFEKMGLREHLTPQRSNGFRAMVERIRAEANAALARCRCVSGGRTGFSVCIAKRPRTAAPRYLRRRRCWPSPICLASWERAAA